MIVSTIALGVVATKLLESLTANYEVKISLAPNQRLSTHVIGERTAVEIEDEKRKQEERNEKEVSRSTERKHVNELKRKTKDKEHDYDATVEEMNLCERGVYIISTNSWITRMHQIAFWILLTLCVLLLLQLRSSLLEPL